MVEFARRESGVLCYERYASAERAIIHVHERYVDSDAAAAHLRAFKSKFGDRFEPLVERQWFHVFGPASDELKGMLAPLDAIYLNRLAGV